MLVQKSKLDLGKRARWIVFGTILSAISVAIFYCSFNIHQISQSYYEKEFPKMLDQYSLKKKTDYFEIMRKAIVHSVKGYFGLFSDSTPESININIKFKHLEKIKAKRSEVLNDTIFLFANDDDYVPAVIEHRNRKIKVKLRLKGDGNDHLKDAKKWSFRLKTRKGDHFLGMRKFSIQHPKTRGYTYEPVFHKTMKDLGVLSLRYDFINVSINGEPIGVMALEEHFSKELLENQGRKEGLIFKASEDKYWEYFLHQVYYKRMLKSSGRKPWSAKKLDNVRRTYTNALNVPFSVYGQKKADQSDFLKDQRELGAGMLRGLVHGFLKPSDVFDIESVGRFAAGLWFWESHHPANVVNVRYYLNPYTMKFEVIAFDANAQEKWNFRTLYLQTHGRQLMQLIMSDEKILASFRKEAGILHEKILNGYVKELKSLSDGYRTKLASEFPLLPRINFGKIRKRALRSYPDIEADSYFKKPKKPIKNIHFPKDFELPGVVYAYVTDTDQGKQLELQNILMDNVSITEMNVSVDGIETEISKVIDIDLPLILPPTQRDHPAETVAIQLKNINHNQKISVSGQASPSRQDRSYGYVSQVYARKTDSHPLESSSIEEIQASNSFIEVNKADKEILIRSGSWIVDQMWVLPYGFSLIIEPGTTLRFHEDSGFIVFGGGDFRGTSKQPITLKPLNPDENSSWSGIAFLEGSESSWSHVNVYNTRAIKYNNWSLTGAITFYKTNINLENVTFSGTIAEDALNIIRSDFSMDNVTIRNTRSDGFDGDFTSGKILNSTFEDIGGDGIDFSGSKIYARASSFDNIFDKAISAGESSEVTVEQVEIRNSGTGGASKDRSILTVTDSEFRNIRHSVLMSYMKKPEYGGSVLAARDIKYQNHELALIAQKGSQLLIDGIAIKPIKIDIDKLYKEGHMKK